MFIPGIVSATFKNLKSDEIVELAAENGLGAIEWSENWHIREGDTAESKRLASLCRASGLDIAALGSYYRLGCGMDFTTRLSVAEALGAPVIRIWAGDKPSDRISPEEMKALAEEGRSIALEAEKRGIITALEWHKNTLTDTNESAFEFLERVGSENLRCLWQPTMALTHEEKIVGLKGLGTRLVNLHVYYWDETGRRPLEEGLSEWKRYLSAADRSTDRYALLEFVKDDSVKQFREDAKTLLDLLHEFQ